MFTLYHHAVGSGRKWLRSVTVVYPPFFQRTRKNQRYTRRSGIGYQVLTGVEDLVIQRGNPQLLDHQDQAQNEGQVYDQL